MASNRVKLKGKAVSVRATKAMKGFGGMDPLILNFDTGRTEW